MRMVKKSRCLAAIVPQALLLKGRKSDHSPGSIDADDHVAACFFAEVYRY